MGLLKRSEDQVSDDITLKAWRSILSEYHNYIDPASFDAFIRSTRKDVKWDIDLVEMRAALSLAEIGVESGWNALAEIGITGDLKKVRQKIRGRITNHEISGNNNNKKDHEPIDFYEAMAYVIKNGYSINSNILLPEWAGILKSISNNEWSN
jgi:hypothetical protein